MNFLQNYIMLCHGRGVANLREIKDNNGEIDEFELSGLVTALYVDPELSRYSEGELQAAVMKLITE